MDWLSGRDMNVVLDFLRELYAATDLSQFLAYVPAGIRRLTHAERASYNVVGFCFEAHLDPAADALPGAAQVLQWYRAHYAEMQRQHPLLAYWRKTRDGGAVKISDFLTRSQYHRLPLYNEALRHFGTESAMRISLPLSADTLAGITIGRGRPDFSERERLILNLVRPHVAQADRNARALSRLRDALAQASRTMEQLPMSVVICERDGRVRTATRSAWDLLSRYFDHRIQADRLPGELERWVRECVLAAQQNPDRVPTVLVLEHDGRRLVVRFLANPDGHAVLLEERVSGEDLEVVPPQALESLGLTPREAEVLALAIRGETNLEIGAALGASARTIGKHLEHIYGKLGVSTRAAAITYALRCLSIRRTGAGSRNARPSLN